MFALSAVASLGVDLGRIQLAKTELRRAVDAATLAAAVKLPTNSIQAKTDAITIAGLHTVNGITFVLASSDIETGNWSGTAFTNNGVPLNAVRITGRLTASGGKAIPLVFGTLVGKSSCDLTVQSIATFTSSAPTGFTSLNTWPINKKFFAASYDSTNTTTPSHTNHTNNCIMQSNGILANASHAGCFLYGSATVGPSGSVAGGLNTTGATTVLSSPITASEPTMQVVTNPGGVPQSASVPSGTFACGPGTYYITSMTMAANTTISFSGPAVIYLDGNASLSTGVTLSAYQNRPENLIIYQSAGHTFSAGDNLTLTGVYYGPGCNISFDQWLNFEGSAVAKSISVTDNDDMYYDESLATSSKFITTSLVK